MIDLDFEASGYSLIKIRTGLLTFFWVMATDLMLVLECIIQEDCL